MSKLCIIGHSTSISQELLKLLPASEEILTIGRNRTADIQVDLATFDSSELIAKLPTDFDKYAFSIGLLHSQRISQQTDDQIQKSLALNLISIVQAIEFILNNNSGARIVVIGSESGEKGSFDTTYFLAKAALHAYIRERAISHPKQQLVGIAPSIIKDSGMTIRRKDQGKLSEIIDVLPKRRLLYAREVAQLSYFLLYTDEGYLTNTVIPLNGGKFSRMT